jgi:hypothetical protein
LSFSYLQSRKRFFPKPSLPVAFRKRAGMIWSVSIFSILRGTAVLVIVFNSLISLIFKKHGFHGLSTDFTDLNGFLGNTDFTDLNGFHG